MYLLITLVIIMGTAKCHKTMSDSELIKLPNHPIPNFMHQEEEQQQLETLFLIISVSFLSSFHGAKKMPGEQNFWKNVV